MRGFGINQSYLSQETLHTVPLHHCISCSRPAYLFQEQMTCWKIEISTYMYVATRGRAYVTNLHRMETVGKSREYYPIITILPQQQSVIASHEFRRCEFNRHHPLQRIHMDTGWRFHYRQSLAGLSFNHRIEKGNTITDYSNEILDLTLGNRMCSAATRGGFCPELVDCCRRAPLTVAVTGIGFGLYQGVRRLQSESRYVLEGPIAMRQGRLCIRT